MHFNYPKNNIYTYPASRSNQTTEEYYNNEIVVISTEWKGKNDFSFCATVLKSNGDRRYSVGEYSNSWHKKDFHLVEEPITLTFTN